MKVCYIGPILDGTGYSRAAIEYIMSLDAAGAEVAVRSVRMTNSNFVDPQVMPFTEIDLMDVDAVIQHNLPSQWSYVSGAQNIGMFAYETDHLLNTGWKYNLLLMDKIIVFCEDQRDAIEKTFKQKTHNLWNRIKDKIYVVPHAVDTTKFHKFIHPEISVDKNNLNFYAIGEWNQRKNWPALLLAYYSSFSSKNNVSLIVKTNDGQEFKSLCANIKQKLNRFTDKTKYPKVVIVDAFLSEDEMTGLHSLCDVYISTSHAESWNLPCIDALGMGNPVIVPKDGAFLDYMRLNLGLMTNGCQGICFDSKIDNLYSCSEQWFNISTKSLQENMMALYNDFNLGKENRWFTKDDKNIRRDYVSKNFNRDVVGKKLMEVIYAKSS